MLSYTGWDICYWGMRHTRNISALTLLGNVVNNQILRSVAECDQCGEKYLYLHTLSIGKL